MSAAASPSGPTTGATRGAYDFDCPQHFEFNAASPPGAAKIDDWFATHEDTPMREARLEAEAHEAERAAASPPPQPQQEQRFSMPEEATPLKKRAPNAQYGATAVEEPVAAAAAAAVPHAAAASESDESADAESTADENAEPKAKKRGGAIRNLVTKWASSPRSKKARATAAAAKASAARPPKQPKERKPSRRERRAEARAAKAAADASGSDPATPTKKARKASGKGPRGITVPKTPTCMRRSSRSSSKLIKSTEELELEAFKQKQREMKERRKLSASSFKRLSQSGGYTPVRSSKPLTQPREFNFKTRQPMGPKRDSSSSGGGGNGGGGARVVDTLPQEPNLHGMVLRSTAPSKYRPTRTTPQPFNLSTRTRAPAATHAVYGESHHRQHHQHGARSGPTVVTSGHVERSEASKPAGPTRPVSPQLRTKQRAKQPATPSEVREAEYVRRQARSFKAKPVNHAILSGPTGVPAPAPPKPPTEPAPFAVSARSADAHAARERAQSLAEQAAAEQRRFTARPVPDYDVSAGIPNVRSKPVTQPEPFELRSERLREKARRELAERVCQLELEQHEAAQFRARPVPASVLNDPAQQQQQQRAPPPAAAARPLTEARPFSFQTNTRLADRHTYDAKVREKREREEAESARTAALRQAEDERELKRLRRDLVHKAQPVPVSQYTVMRVRGSTRAPTEPVSPMLGQKRSLRV